MPNFALEIEYLGTNYHGWQIQDNAHTVQAEVNRALGLLLKHKVETLGCGRTDTGVHAKCQIVQFSSDSELVNLGLVRRLNALLPPDIAINAIYKLYENANVRFDAISRTYRYRLHLKKTAFDNQRSILFTRTLDTQLLFSSAQVYLGENHFTNFGTRLPDDETGLCNITLSEWSQEPDMLIYTVTGNRFIRGMVRALVGCMLNVSTKKLTIDKLDELVKGTSAVDLSAKAPAKGLTLEKVIYPNNYLMPLTQ